MKKMILLALVFTAWCDMMAQSGLRYGVRLGYFEKVERTDFEDVQRLGYVYGINHGDNIEVRLGDFEVLMSAQTAVKEARSLGYSGVEIIHMEDKNVVYSVQVLSFMGTGKTPAWNKLNDLGPLYVVPRELSVKIFAGKTQNRSEIESILKKVKSNGYADAFIKKVPEQWLHLVGDFERGKLLRVGLAQEAITSGFQWESQETKTPVAKENHSSKASVAEYIAIDKRVVSKGLESYDYSHIRFRFDRDELEYADLGVDIDYDKVLMMQNILSSMGYYKSVVDGKYGKITEQAISKAWNGERNIRKYRLIAKELDQRISIKSDNDLQNQINEMFSKNWSGKGTLKQSDWPLSKAYLGYHELIKNKDYERVATLVNEALSDVGKATYKVEKYSEAEFVASKILEVHGFSPRGKRLMVPCWMLAAHGAVVEKAFDNPQLKNDLSFEDCGGFENWDEVAVLNSMMNDVTSLEGGTVPSHINSVDRAKLIYYALPIYSEHQETELLEWERKLMYGINNWRKKDNTLNQLGRSMLLTYSKLFLGLKAHYRLLSIDDARSTAMAIGTIKALSNGRLKRLISS